MLTITWLGLLGRYAQRRRLVWHRVFVEEGDVATVLLWTTFWSFSVWFLIPGGGRNDVDPRFISLFSVFNMTFPSDETLFLIYNSILQGHCQSFSAEIQELVSSVTKMTMVLYRWVGNFRPSSWSVEQASGGMTPGVFAGKSRLRFTNWALS